mmetsp:Transcript_15965/g.33819  ORF Transcript_15965/g.33819 Transcript_15965/m.33819 type:complete len:232 (+) Transcript_15965:887-1582(+)
MLMVHADRLAGHSQLKPKVRVVAHAVQSFAARARSPTMGATQVTAYAKSGVPSDAFRLSDCERRRMLNVHSDPWKAQQLEFQPSSTRRPHGLHTSPWTAIDGGRVLHAHHGTPPTPPRTFPHWRWTATDALLEASRMRAAADAANSRGAAGSVSGGLWLERARPVRVDPVRCILQRLQGRRWPPKCSPGVAPPLQASGRRAGKVSTVESCPWRRPLRRPPLLQRQQLRRRR